MPGVSGGYIVKIDRQDRPDPCLHWDLRTIRHRTPAATRRSGSCSSTPPRRTLPKPTTSRSFVDHFEDATCRSHLSRIRPSATSATSICARSSTTSSSPSSAATWTATGAAPSCTNKPLRTATNCFAGPLWDMDLAWGHADFCGATDVPGWAYRVRLDLSGGPKAGAVLVGAGSSRMSPTAIASAADGTSCATACSPRQALLAMVDSIASIRRRGAASQLPALAHARACHLARTFARTGHMGGRSAGGEGLDRWPAALWMDEHLPALVNGCARSPVCTSDPVDSLTIWPNPFAGEVNAFPTSRRLGELHTMEVCDAIGRVLHHRVLDEPV
jgi:hypothetical protein